MSIREFEFEFIHFDAPQAVREIRRGVYPLRFTGNVRAVKHFTDIDAHDPKRKFRSRSEMGAYIRLQRLKHLGISQGEIIKLAKTGYIVIEPMLEDYKGVVNVNPDHLRMAEGDALLIDDRGNIISSGELENTKRLGIKFAMDGKFEYDYYIISKSQKKSFLISGGYDLVTESKQRSTSKKLVLPMYRYVLYGYLPSKAFESS